MANRVRYYLGRNDPDLVIAAILHDSVEDHADELVSEYYVRLNQKNQATSLSGRKKQEIALLELEYRFGARSAEIVSEVTNPPKDDNIRSHEDSFSRYLDKVTNAVTTVDGWCIKFCDWSDNGPGIDDEDDDDTPRGRDDSPEHLEHFMRKYGLAQPILESRFDQKDVQKALGLPSIKYVRKQFDLGRKRLLVPDTKTKQAV